jgi:ribosomal protein S27AE
MCIRCNERPAEVPDRRTYTGGRFVKQVCSVCHGKLLRGDLIRIVLLENKREADRLDIRDKAACPTKQKSVEAPIKNHDIVIVSKNPTKKCPKCGEVAFLSERTGKYNCRFDVSCGWSGK